MVMRVAARTIAAATAVLLVPPSLAAGAPVSTQSTGAAIPTATGIAGPLFSAPTYLPLRKPARVSCVKTNCRLADGRIYHNGWAIDFIGTFGAPVHPAGYGIAHVGGRVSGCRDTSDARGNWVWVDHGGGELTKYYHLRKILVRNGQRVTPDTKLGEMGGTGAARCKLAYLHFERRVTNRVSIRVAPATMWGCAAGRPVAFPRANGYSTWNMPKLKKWVRSGGTGCIKRPPRAGQPHLVSVRPSRSHNGLAVRWRAPGQNPHLVTGYRVSVSLWHPRSRDWGAPIYHTVRGKATAVTVPRLQFRRTYRVRVAARDGAGHSPWTMSRNAVIARPPGRPPITRLQPTRHTLRVAWKIPPNGGNRITQYRALLARGGRVIRVAILSPRQRSVTWRKLAARSQHTVGVVALNQAGMSPASVRRIRTR